MPRSYAKSADGDSFRAAPRMLDEPSRVRQVGGRSQGVGRQGWKRAQASVDEDRAGFVGFRLCGVRRLFVGVFGVVRLCSRLS